EWSPHNWDNWDWHTVKPARRKNSSASHAHGSHKITGTTESETTESSTEKANQISELSSSLEMGSERIFTSGVWQKYNRSRTRSLKNTDASLNVTLDATEASMT
ncbi:hypothetical protein GCK32_022579, partial [Trichostrongylus colubriformis]